MGKGRRTRRTRRKGTGGLVDRTSSSRTWTDDFDAHPNSTSTYDCHFCKYVTPLSFIIGGVGMDS